MELLWKLLDLDTQNRISASDALQHPFLSDMESDMEIDATGQNHINLSQYEVRSHIDLLKKNEELLRPDPQYMSKQSMVSESMRTILVDWLVDVSMHFEVMGETLHFAIGYIDRTLSVLEIEKNKLQLVGVTCMKIADVFNEKSKEYYRQDNASEYAYITADEYTSDEVIKMEKQILTLLDFNCYSPTVIHFLKLLNMSEEVKLLSNYLADLMLLTTKPLAFKPSLVANSIMYLACGAINNFEVPENSPELFKLLFGEYPFDEF
jgi:cyclin A